MVLVGMLHYRKRPHDVKKAYAYAAVAKMEGISFFYFSYQQVDFDEKVIQGWIYEKGQWIQKKMGFPDVVINSSSPKTKRQSSILKRLKNKTILTSHSVGNKMTVYQKVMKGEEFQSNLIPSFKLNGVQEVHDLFRDHSILVIKPFSGNHGRDVFFLEKDSDHFLLMEGIHTRKFQREEFNNWIQQLIKDRNFLIQPFVSCLTQAGLTYDFRIHVQKNGQGQWVTNLIYPRISGNGKKISNISSGGYRGEWIPFLKEEFGDKAERLKRSLETFASAFPAHFETLYPYSFDELGIDVGIDQNLRLWIFEVNWRPGSRHREFEVAKRMLPYCLYLKNGSGK
ncbi:YheC/YheD family protein [Rossellomorea aquimaris]|uniref:YheC/YheD family protein n=1 Tax=Rossellomorea aquimaris TaxID=189382 RepID=UPI0005CB4EA4|nr:YheC/YheD family protein [Rossellomorea aquimaris]